MQAITQPFTVLPFLVRFSQVYLKMLQRDTRITLQLMPTRIQPSQPVRIKGVQDGIYTVLLTSSLGATYVASIKVQNGAGFIEPPAGGFSKGFYYVVLKGFGNTEAGSKLVVY